MADCILLGFIGSRDLGASWHFGGVDIALVWLARLGTAYYFGFFWVLMPWLGKKEVTLPPPESIAQATKKER